MWTRGGPKGGAVPHSESRFQCGPAPLPWGGYESTWSGFLQQLELRKHQSMLISAMASKQFNYFAFPCIPTPSYVDSGGWQEGVRVHIRNLDVDVD